MPNNTFKKCISKNLKDKGIDNRKIKLYNDYFDNRVQFHSSNSPNLSSHDEALKEVLSKIRQDALSKQAQLNNIIRISKNSEKSFDDNIESIKLKGVSDILSSHLDGRPDTKNTSGSVRSLQEFIKQRIFKEGGDEILSQLYTGWGRRRSDINFDNVFRHVVGENGMNDSEKKVGEAVKKILNKIPDIINESGGFTQKYPDNYFPTSFDSIITNRIQRKEFIDDMMNSLDFTKMQHQDGKPILDSEKHSYLSDIYDNITTDRANKLDTSGTSRKTIGSSSSSRQFFYKNADAQLYTMRKYSVRKDALGNMLDHIESAAYQAALINKFGMSPSQGYEITKNMLLKKLANSDIENKNILLQKSKSENLGSLGPDNTFSVLYDRQNSPYANMWKVSTDTLAGTAAVAQLGGVAQVSMLTDNAFTVFSKMFGDRNLKYIGDGFKSMFEYWGSKSARDEAEHMGFIANEYMSSLFSNGIDRNEALGFNNNMPNILKSAGNISMRLSGQTFHDISLARALQVSQVKAISNFKNHTFDELKPVFKSMFDKYGIDEDDWNLIRNSAPNRTGYIAPADVIRNEASGIEDKEELKRLSMSDANSREVARKYLNLVMDQQLFSFLNRPTSEISAFNQSIKGDHPLSIALKSGMMYTSFVNSLRLMTYRMINSPNNSQMKRMAMWASLAGMLGFAGTIATGLKTIENGQNIDFSNPKFWLKSMITGLPIGAFGELLTSFITHKEQQTAATPISGMLTDAFKTVYDTVATATPGNEKWQQNKNKKITFKDTADSSMKTLQDVFPGQNIPILGTILIRHMFNAIHASLAPNSHQYYRNLDKKDRQNQVKRWIPNDDAFDPSLPSLSFNH